MSKKGEQNKKDEAIRDLTTKRVMDILELEPSQIAGDEFDIRLRQARLGMSFIKDREIMKRMVSGHNIRIISLIASDKDERKRYIEATMPEMPILITDGED